MKPKTKTKKILIVHGPNLDLLGNREPGIYGKITLKQINQRLQVKAKKIGAVLKIYQSNHEGKIVDIIGGAGKSFDGIIINPAAYTHTSVAIRDAIASCGLPTIEVHLTNIYTREEFRHKSLVSPVAKGSVMGFGYKSYILGLAALVDLLNAG